MMDDILGDIRANARVPLQGDWDSWDLYQGLRGPFRLRKQHYGRQDGPAPTLANSAGPFGPE